MVPWHLIHTSRLMSVSFYLSYNNSRTVIFGIHCPCCKPIQENLTVIWAFGKVHGQMLINFNVGDVFFSIDARAFIFCLCSLLQIFSNGAISSP